MTDLQATWREFCATFAAAGDIVFAPGAPADPLDQAEGLRYLTRLMRIALEMNLEAADPDFPYFYKASHETGKIGADNPDNIYWNATVSAANTYRITGKRGTMAYFGIGSKANRYHIDGTMASTGELDDSNLAFGADGSLEILVSKTPQPGNWLPMEDDTTFVIIRQSYLDRGSEIPGVFKIERLGGPALPAPLTADFLAPLLTRSAAFVRGTAATFDAWARDYATRPNLLPAQDQSKYWRSGGDPNIYYIHGYFDFPEDHAWVIDVTPPDCRYWNFQINNWWMESLDYRYAPASVNKHTAKRNADGSVTIVIAERDPGVGNFLHRRGHRVGTVLFRWLGAREHPLPTCRVVPLASLTA